MLLALDIERVEPLADGAPFGEAGAYERVIATARGEVDPAHPDNSGIALIDKAPRNAAGKVEYKTDVFILRPRDPARGNGRILYEVNNRGRKMLFGNIADGPQGVNDPKTLADLGNAFPLRQGYTIVWSGWDPDAPRANMGLALTAPIATDNGQPIVQTVREEWVSGTRLGVLETFKLSHEAATLEQNRARLTVRERANDEPRELPLNQWSFVDGRSIKLRDGTKAQPGYLYEFHYDAKNPKVQGLGFAATRDLVSWLRHDPAATKATGAPISHALAIGFSQAGRYLRNHISEGFNRDEQGRRVFDGVHSHIAGVGRIFFNTPFAQPARTNTQHEDHGFPENEFPFSTARLDDPLTGKTGALFRGDGCDPLLIETNTSTEYWQKGASLLHTDPLGTRDIELPANSRVYMIAGTQHGGRAGATTDPGPNINPRNPHNPMPAVRALLVALDEWVISGKAPPPSKVPTLAAGTLVDAGKTGFPSVPGAAVVRVTNSVSPPGDWTDPKPAGKTYRTLVSKVDADGNEVAGVRLPDIAVPLATYTGWNEYKPPYPKGEIADRDGSCLPFPVDKAARESSGDPRPSIAERYKSGADYIAKVQAVVDQLLAERLILPEDAARYIERARREPRVAP
ncbi:alpha/beta hydrolase domain-containing protein [Reyranella massiliensis]|uniref:alpha/beta hydrolase domain-containing protein n=1 Tax=Reyranella massiliensis TaxID=445220 RepID=UPI0002F5274B|nr:alpha/beta hydrolase domain-containing protein [Reyranella massiliensis]